MFIKAMYNNEECLLNADYIVDIFNADKWVADVYVLDIDRDCYKVKQSEIQRLIDDTADTPQTEMDKCYKCKWWNYSYGCSNKKGICDFEQADTPQTEETCERCVYVRGSQWCQGCNGTPKRWDGEKIVDTPQTGSTGSPIGDYRDGVGAWSDCPWK